MEKNILLLSTTLLFSTATFAQNWYVEGGASLIEFDDGTDIISPANLYIRGGYQFNRYFNVGLETTSLVYRHLYMQQ